MPPSAQDLPGAVLLAGRGSVRSGAADDAIGGVVPTLVVEPDTREALAEMLAWSSRERQSVVIRGGGTKLGWGRVPEPIDLILSTRRLNRVLVHAHGDLTATVEGGAPLAEVNRELGRHHQFLALDASFDGATVGGTIATNDSGSLRHRYGTPRDLLIGIHLATTDGRIVKAGGNVVKNVAGYDLGKLMSGSFGSLAAIVSATFKLSPVPTFSSTLIAGFDRPNAAAAARDAVVASQLEPTAFDLHVVVGGSQPARYELLLRFASTPDAVAAELQHGRQLIAADRVEEVTGEREADVWRDLARASWTGAGAVIRMSWLPALLPLVLSLLQDVASSGVETEIVGRAAVGAGFVRLDGEPQAQIAALQRLRAANDVVGHVVLLSAAPAVKATVGVWPPIGDSANVLQAIKRSFDPAGILNAGRGFG